VMYVKRVVVLLRTRHGSLENESLSQCTLETKLEYR